MSDEIMVANESALDVAAKNSVNFEIPTGYICTVDISTLEGKLDVQNALNGADSLSKRMNETLILKNVVTTQGVRSVSGDVCTNTHLILADGTTLFSQSDGVARSIATLVALFTTVVNGVPVCDFGEGLPIKCIETKLRNGNTLKSIVAVRA